MRRMNLGCGSVQPEGWDNVDAAPLGQEWQLDVAHMDPSWRGPIWRFITERNSYFVCPDKTFVDYDYIVCNHMLSDIAHHDLPGALTNIRSMLKDGGVLRILVPDAHAAFCAWEDGNEGWFPQDDRTGGIHAKFCTFVTWFGESKSIFTWGYLFALLSEAGFWPITKQLDQGETLCSDPEIMSLDGDRTTSILVEAVRK